MPSYEYQCPKCNEKFTFILSTEEHYFLLPLKILTGYPHFGIVRKLIRYFAFSVIKPLHFRKQTFKRKRIIYCTVDFIGLGINFLAMFFTTRTSLLRVFSTLGPLTV